MKVEEQDLIHALNGIKSVHDADDLERLERFAQQLHEFGASETSINAFLSIFERFPVEDGFGVFWAILHGLEKLPGYESHLLQSLQRQPAEFSLRMVERIINSGGSQIDGIDLSTLLKSIAKDSKQAPNIREYAQRIIEKP